MTITDNPEYAQKNEIKTAFSSAFFLYEHKLGLCFWNIPTLYAYTHSLFIKLLQQPIPQAGSAGIISFHFLINVIKLSMMFVQEATRAVEISRVLVLINADNYTGWNYR